ncbi:MAG TPA: response regulator [Patescibacteria group bacterium]|nr:response regulator [Patescibacteria group bacterium]
MAGKDIHATILLAEDDELISQMYTTKLTHDGFKVVVAKDGEESIAQAEKGGIDLILLDIIMPKVDGFGVLEKLKKDEKTKNIPVVMLTNLGQDEDIEKGKALGAYDYLIKANLTPQQVSDKIKSVLKDVVNKK